MENRFIWDPSDIQINKMDSVQQDEDADFEYSEEEGSEPVKTTYEDILSKMSNIIRNII